MQEYLGEAIAAVELDGVSIKGYFAWSVLDNFEWAGVHPHQISVLIFHSTLGICQL